MQKYNPGFSDKIKPYYHTRNGISEKVVRGISKFKKEPSWMLKKRLDAYKIFSSKSMPSWSPDISGLDFGSICYYAKASKSQAESWNKVPKSIKSTFDKIGVPKNERDNLSGLGAQYDSEIVYQSISKILSKKGVIFCDTDTALQKYPKMFKEYFGKIIPSSDNKFSALNTAVWSGGSFIYVPKGIKIELPLQAYFRINTKNLGQFERTLIIAEEKSFVHFTEGCTAPIYDSNMLHAGVVEIFVKKGAHVKYTTVQNWSRNVYNLVTKRMHVEEDGISEWLDINLGSKITMKYPSIHLNGERSKGNILSLSMSGENQNQDCGAKVIHSSSDTSSSIISKSIAKKGGQTTFRGLVKVTKGAKNCKSKMVCHSLLLDEKSKTNSFPNLNISEDSSRITHEAVVSSVEEDQLFYLQSRGISRKNAESLIVNGFAEQIVKELPIEYSVELNRLIQMGVEE